jgi:hypothetical protein
MNNRVTLSDLRAMPIGAVAELPPGPLMLLLEDAEAAIEAARTAKAWLEGALGLKYGERAAAALAAAGKDTGSIRFDDHDITVVVETPKKVEWDQSRLASLVSLMVESGDCPAEYVEISYRVPERKYAAWPNRIREAFAPARSVRIGKPSFRLQPKADEAAR